MKRDLATSGRTVSFHQADVTDTEKCLSIVGKESFDYATLLHIGMNIANKRLLAKTVFAALKPGGTFLLYEQMSHVFEDTEGGDINDELTYPLPWATIRENSHVASMKEYTDAMTEAGFALEAKEVVTEKRDVTFYRDYRLDERKGILGSELPPMGIHVLMHPDLFKQKVANMKQDWAEGKMGCVNMVWKKPLDK